jgi:putative restriction endonuclease
MTIIGDELSRRLHLWTQISAADARNVEPSELRSLLIYGGAQGIWVDKKRTGSLSQDGRGVTVGILHTGQHYPDDLSDDGLIYHYPSTRRSPGRDDAEVQATKNAAKLGLPIFIVSPGSSSSAKRSVRLGWVVDSDDENQQFLILFGDNRPSYEAPAETDSPFELVGGPAARTGKTKVRPGQQQFRFQVLAKYGCKCAVCSITHPSLMKAAHICGKAHLGSDDWRNGIPLCSTHHDAFDAHLFSVHPDTLAIQSAPGVSLSSIGVVAAVLAPAHQRPHRDALTWRFEKTKNIWGAKIDSLG